MKRKQNSYSFDIFDTCFVRACGNPHYVFDLLGSSIIGKNATDIQIADFTRERMMSERNVRNLSYKVNPDIEEVTLDEIYEACDFSQWTSVSKDKIKEKELEIEKNLLLPVDSIKEEIDYLHGKGFEIIYISDMYMPELFVLDLLKEYGFWKECDHLYISSKYRKTKYSGHLYEYIHNELGLVYSNWVHRGDNMHSDVEIPSSLGIKTRKVEHDYTRYENLLFNRDLSISFMNGHGMASICKAIRLSNNITDPKADFALHFVAPVLVTYVHSIFCDATKRGIKHLYFLSRDGYILMYIAKQMSAVFPDISLNYIYVSRKSLWLPGLLDLDSESFKDYIIGDRETDGKENGIKDILEKLQMSEYVLKDNLWNNLNSRQVIDKLMDDKNFVSILKKKQIEQRNLCINYFRQEGLTRNHSAIVDIISAKRSLRAINNILNKNNYNPVFGYYLYALGSREKEQDYYTVFFTERLVSNKINFTHDAIGLIEHYFCMSDHNRTSSYNIKDGIITPIFEPEEIDETFRNTVWKTNLTLCELFTKYYIQIVRTDSPNALCRLSMSVYSDFVISPSIDFLRAIKNLTFTGSKEKSYKLLRKRSLISIYKDRKTEWPAADLIYNAPFHKIVSFVLYARKVIKANF